MFFPRAKAGLVEASLVWLDSTEVAYDVRVTMKVVSPTNPG